jgi:hypothetical protein
MALLMTRLDVAFAVCDTLEEARKAGESVPLTVARASRWR